MQKPCVCMCLVSCKYDTYTCRFLGLLYMVTRRPPDMLAVNNGRPFPFSGVKDHQERASAGSGVRIPSAMVGLRMFASWYYTVARS